MIRIRKSAPGAAARWRAWTAASASLLALSPAWAGEPTAPRVEYLGTDAHAVYVECWPGLDAPRREATLVFVHGASHTGVVFTATPDGRPGWAPWFSSRGFGSCVVDLPGHGRAPAVADFARMPIGAATTGLLELIDRRGPVVLIGHSMGGRVIQETLAAASAEQRDAVRAVVLLAPVGPADLTSAALPGFPITETGPFRFDRALEVRLFTMAGDAPAPQFPQHALDQYLRSLVPESARSINEFTVPGLAAKHGPDLFSGVRTLIVGAEGDNAVPPARLEAAAQFWGVELALLGADWGLAGNGHLFPIELNNTEIAARVAAWLDTTPKG